MQILDNKGLCLKGDWWNNIGKLIECQIDYCELQELEQKCINRQSHDSLYFEDLSRLKDMRTKALLWECA